MSIFAVDTRKQGHWHKKRADRIKFATGSVDHPKAAISTIFIYDIRYNSLQCLFEHHKT